MADHGLQKSRVPLPNRLGLVDDPAHLSILPVREHDAARPPVLLEPRGPRRARDGNEALRGDPGERDLGDRAALPRRELPDLVHDGLVLVEVLPLELGNCCCRMVCQLRKAKAATRQISLSLSLSF